MTQHYRNTVKLCTIGRPGDGEHGYRQTSEVNCIGAEEKKTRQIFACDCLAADAEAWMFEQLRWGTSGRVNALAQHDLQAAQ